MTLGRYPGVSLAEARAAAEAAREQARNGINPAAEHAVTVAEQIERRNQTVAAVAEPYFEHFAKTVSADTYRDDRRAFELTVESSPLAKMPISDVETSDLYQWLDAAKSKYKPATINRACRQIRGLFRWGLRRGYYKGTSPALEFTSEIKSESRDVFLDDDELRVLWNATDDLEAPYSQYYKFLILSGQRRTQTARIKWNDIDRKEAAWTVPKEDTKSKRAEIVPLTSQMLKVLDQLGPAHGGYIFAQKGSQGAEPIRGFSKNKKRLDKIVGDAITKDWRIHDFRRSQATGLAKMGVQIHVIDMVAGRLSYARSGVSGVYNQHSYIGEKRKALETWCNHIAPMSDGDKTVLQFGDKK